MPRAGTSQLASNGRGLPWTAALPFSLLCLALNAVVWAGVALNRPSYLRDYRLGDNPDARHYVLLGRNLLLVGHYSRCERPPYAPDIVRTPVYPLFAGVFDIVGNAAAIYLAQAVLQAGSCLLLFLLVRPLFGGGAALWASVLLGTDLMLAVSNFEAMSEPLFIFLLLASCVCLLPVLIAVGEEEGPAWPRPLLGGALLGLAILTRPAALYLPLVFAVACLALGIARGRRTAALRTTVLLVASALFPAGLWVARNESVFSVPRLTTIDVNNMVYFVGAGAYQVRHHASLEEAQSMISREFGLPPYVVLQNHWTAGQSVAELDAELHGARWRVLRKYPRELVVSSVLGIVKAGFSHNVGTLADLWGRSWIPPRTGALLRLRSSAFDRLLQNGPPLSAAFVWQLLHVMISLITGLVGAALALKDPRTRTAGLILGVVLVYFSLTTALFGLEAYCRCRIPVLPFLYAFAGGGLAQLAGPRRPAPGACGPGHWTPALQTSRRCPDVGRQAILGRRA